MTTTLDDQLCWEAVLTKDGRLDGEFFYAVSTTGVYCRPSCPSRIPSRDHVQFFAKADAAEQAGFRPCRRCRPRADLLAPFERLRRYIEDHCEERLTLEDLAGRAGLSPSHFQRKFTAAFGLSPHEFAAACRTARLKHGLRAAASVTDAIYAAGYGSGSRVYERSRQCLGMTPASYRAKGRGEIIRYAVTGSPLGPMLVAATARGVCAIRFGDSGEELEAGLRREFAAAEIGCDIAAVQPWIDALLDHLRRGVEIDLPLDIRATAFQQKVWAYLRAIPAGRTASYSAVAEAIGEPRAVRAVARACASNPVAVAIPCHRVVRADGEMGGYRWGVDRKKSLLDTERARTTHK